MGAVQGMCARVGMVTGGGLMDALREKFPRPVLMMACVALLAANTINVAADLSAMADAMGMMSGVNSHIWVVLFGTLLTWATVEFRYLTIAKVLKWLALALFAYVVTAIKIGPHWGPVLRDTFWPRMPAGSAAWATVVAILGTTISPYLFFWQASQEVEEEKASGRSTRAERGGATQAEFRRRKVDVGVGTFFSNLAMFFIILTTALTLHAHGVTQLNNSRDVAEALRPLAGRFSAVLFTVGLLGAGALAIPTLAGSSAYAFAELFGWRQGIDEPFRGAPAFYAVVIAAMGAGVALNFSGVPPIKALYWSAVVNGVLAPFLLAGVLIVASDKRIMRGQASSQLGRITVGATMAVMFVAVVAMFVIRG
jgi:Mn2+/Fe2+ NRAMP family transporter